MTLDEKATKLADLMNEKDKLVVQTLSYEYIEALVYAYASAGQYSFNVPAPLGIADEVVERLRQEGVRVFQDGLEALVIWAIKDFLEGPEWDG